MIATRSPCNKPISQYHGASATEVNEGAVSELPIGELPSSLPLARSRGLCDRLTIMRRSTSGGLGFPFSGALRALELLMNFRVTGLPRIMSMKYVSNLLLEICPPGALHTGLLRPLCRLVLACWCLVLISQAWAQDSRPEDTPGQSPAGPIATLPTIAESSNYTATANAVEVESYLRRLANDWPGAELASIGRTVEGRPIWALLIEPQAASESKPLTVLMLGGIHAGECDGKEALLALARSMSIANDDKWWQTLRLIFVPNFNADGNERRGTHHRPGQAGPITGVGLRENAQALDLNRDFIKLESPEVRSLVAALHEYDVDVLIDTHTTNGSLHRYELTYDIPHNPNVAPATDRWLRNQLLPRVTERMEQAGFATFYYGNFDVDHRRWETYGHEPRYATEYMALRGRIGILAESYSYASYQRRIDASFAFVREVLQALAEHASEVRHMLDQATVPPHTGLQLALDGKLVSYMDEVSVRGFQTAQGTPPQPPFGPASLTENTPTEYRVQLWNRAEATAFTSIPIAYALDQQYAWAVSRLAKHGVRLKRLKHEVTIDVEQYTIESVQRGKPFQGHTRPKLDVKAMSAKATLGPGTYIIETEQPLGLLAAYLLEPGADDSLATWNFFDPDLDVGKHFPALRVVQFIDPDSLTDLEVVGPAELLTLEHLYMPDRTVNYGGGTVRGTNWLKDQPEYVVRRDEGSFAVAAATGAVRPIEEIRTLGTEALNS